MGQLRSKTCPVCTGPNGGRWTCPPCTDLVNVHRELLRNLQKWDSLVEAQEAPDTLSTADGRSYCLWDVKVFYERRTALPPRQRSALELCLFSNKTESDAAVMMGIAETNPVAMYATAGLARLLNMAMAGQIAGYRLQQSSTEGSAA